MIQNLASQKPASTTYSIELFIDANLDGKFSKTKEKEEDSGYFEIFLSAYFVLISVMTVTATLMLLRTGSCVRTADTSYATFFLFSDVVNC